MSLRRSKSPHVWNTGRRVDVLCLKVCETVLRRRRITKDCYRNWQRGLY
ncbi:unnamed protein product [Acanthoscelides obtectus]|uniref:Uncharacterized protein n=1 Tax=Acanthoscelides obtectus TaxID=200917 RepID=A0A9P0LCV3_ACAOB|nr:unnamed protein product [Acanthoscelides obtectus]CAK1627325.1 hypothetical protein AOBTE_LOCUS4520 [Acanthoscelides obtectus]